MKLNPDCVRDLLLTLEERLQFGSDGFTDMQYPRLHSNEVAADLRMKPYSTEDIAYTTLKLIDAGFIDAAVIPGDSRYNGAIYGSITYDGHQFLETIRPPDVWEETKAKAKSVGSFALDVLSNIAARVLSARINAQF